MDWLKRIEITFQEPNTGDFYCVVEDVLSKGKLSFLNILLDNSKGFGIGTNEYIYYSLDSDWDNPEDFDKVEINVGSMGGSTSSLTLNQFYQLLELLALSYIQDFPNDETKVRDYLGRIKRRYAKLIAQSDDGLIALIKQRLANAEPSFKVDLDDI